MKLRMKVMKSSMRENSLPCNYCGQMGNKGALIRFEAPDLKPDIVTFSAVPHPDVKPMAYANNFLLMFS